MLPTGDPLQVPSWLQLESWLGRLAKRWGFLTVVGIAVLTFGFRCLRLADPNHYYLYSPDSYFFHWLAQRVMAGQGPPPGSPSINYTLHSGLAYPLAYIGKAAGSVFSLSSEESLALAAKFLPPMLAVITMIVIYIAASKIWSRAVALFAALAWALMFLPIFVTTAGYTDRDGLSLLLLLTGALFFYFTKGYRAYVGKIDVGWLLAGLGVLGVEGLLYLEWGLTGAGILVAVLLSYAVLKSLLGYLALLDTEPNTRVRISTAVKKLEWHTLAFITCVNIAAIGLYHHQAASFFTGIWGTLRTQSSGKVFFGPTEAAGLSFSDIIAFQFFLIPIAVGLYSAWKNRDDASILFSGWFLSFGILSLVAWRLLLYSIPGMCITAGLGLGYLWEWRRRSTAPLTRTLGVGVLLILLLVFSFIQSASLNSQQGGAVDTNWQEALAYLRENTPQDAVVMSQWSPGYWILDLGQRRPFVDNGYYGYDPGKLWDVGHAYLATDPSVAAEIMARDGTDYLLFSKDDFDAAGAITQWGGLNGANSFPSDSLVVRSLNGEFVSGGGLDVVYHNSELVILGLTGDQGQ